MTSIVSDIKNKQNKETDEKQVGLSMCHGYNLDVGGGERGGFKQVKNTGSPGVKTES